MDIIEKYLKKIIKKNLKLLYIYLEEDKLSS